MILLTLFQQRQFSIEFYQQLCATRALTLGLLWVLALIGGACLLHLLTPPDSVGNSRGCAATLQLALDIHSREMTLVLFAEGLLPMGTELDGFESIGANCEFGQLLRKVGNETLTAFRWTGILSVEALISALDANLYGIFRFENLVPFNSDMILDRRSRIAWHSEIKSERIGPDESGVAGTLRFTQTEPQRKWLYAKQRFAVRLLCDKMRRSLREGRVIFVYIPPPSDEACFSSHSMVRIFEALNRRGSHKLLVVTNSSSSQRPGNIDILRPGLVHGFIDRFAPGDNTTDLSLDCWLTLCRKAKRAMQETRMNA